MELHKFLQGVAAGVLVSVATSAILQVDFGKVKSAVREWLTPTAQASDAAIPAPAEKAQPASASAQAPAKAAAAPAVGTKDPAIGANEATRTPPVVVGEVDWGAGVISATGYGASPKDAVNEGQATLMALGAAELDAQRILAATLAGVRVDACHTMRDYILRDGRVQSQVSAILKGARIVSRQTWQDGTASVTLQLSLPKTATAAMNVATTPATPRTSVKDSLGPARQAGKGASEADRAVAEKALGVYTGLVIDARGLGIRPALSPKIYDRYGKVIYEGAHVTPGYAETYGVIGYARDEQAVARLDRVGCNPLVVRAVAARGEPVKVDVVVDDSTARKLEECVKYLRFFEECRVVFLVDEARGL